MRHSKKTILAFLLACAISSAFLALQSGTAATSQSSATPTSQKATKDQAEFNAFIAARNEKDAVKKAALMEAFVQEYPQSIARIDALEQAMAAYQEAGNAAKLEDTARRIIVIDPAHVRSLAILAYITRAKGTPEAAKEALAYAERGLDGLPKWTIPEGTSETDFQKLRTEMFLIFYGAAGWGHLQKKEFAPARDNYLKALQIDPTDLQNTFQVGYALLESEPIDLNGFWYAVKAANLAQAAGNAAGTKQILDYAKAKYRKYHGDNNGWDAFVASVATQKAPPPAAGLAQAITKAPTLCELAVKAVKEYKPEDLSFADYEFVLQHRDCSPANKEAAGKVWATIQEKQKNGEVKLRLNGVKVIAATKDNLDAALTDDNQQANKADLHVVMEKPMVSPPAPGSMIDVIGVITGYKSEPFLFTMEKGDLPAAHLSRGRN
jgi:tetratricopeptide (TPR) repeat protein